MIVSALKVILSFSIITTCIYSINIFEAGMWSIVFLVVGLIILFSVFINSINNLAIILSRVTGVLSLLCLLLLLLAGTIGGSFNMSESNEFIGFALLIITVLGCSFFLVELSNAST